MRRIRLNSAFLYFGFNINGFYVLPQKPVDARSANEHPTVSFDLRPLALESVFSGNRYCCQRKLFFSY
jgi:hypothetical protein